MQRDPLLDLLEEIEQSESIVGDGDMRPPQPKEFVMPKESVMPNEQTVSFLLPYLTELIDQFENTLKNIKNYARISQEKLSYSEFVKNLSGLLTDETRKIGLVKNMLLDYVKFTTPIPKTGTVNTLIEDELKKYQAELKAKKIKLYKRLEKDLRETAVPDDHLQFILNWILQYSITLLPPNGGLWVFTRFLPSQKETGAEQDSDRKEAKDIEISIVCTGDKGLAEQSGASPGILPGQTKGTLDFGLRLVDEIVQKNRGMMKFEADAKMEKIAISLILPMERRAAFHYRSMDELTLSVDKAKTTFERLLSLEETKEGKLIPNTPPGKGF